MVTFHLGNRDGRHNCYLTGTAKEQSDQWRSILKKIYDAENENSVDLIYMETPRTRGSDKNQNSNSTNVDYKESASRENQTRTRRLRFFI